jgi:O-antigen ligase
VQVSPRLPWHMLLGAVVLVPLAVGVIPVAGIPLTLNSFVQAKLIVLSLMLALALAAWAATEFGGGALRLGRMLVPLVVFLLAAGLSTATALEPRMAFFGDLEQGVGFLVVLMCGLACFLTTQLADSDERSRSLTSAVILTAAAVAVIGLLQQAVLVDVLGIGGASLPEWFMRRGYGTIGNADTYGAYLVLPALLALDRLRRATDRDRLLWGACFIAITSSCVASQTRGSWIALLVGAITWAVLLRARTRNAGPARRGSKRSAKEGRATRPWQIGGVVAASLGVALLVAAVLGDTAGFFRRFGGGDESLLALGGRTPLWGNALRILEAHPILGAGPDSFRLGWYPVREVSQLAQGVGLIITDPHNALLLVAATMGMVGLAAVLYLIGATALSGFRAASGTRAGSPDVGSDHLAWLAGFVALTVALLSSMVTIALLFMLFLAIGVLVAPTLWRIDAPKVSRTVVRAVQVVAGMASVSLLLFSVLTFSAQAVAVGTRSDDADLAHARAASAVSIAPSSTCSRGRPMPWRGWTPPKECSRAPASASHATTSIPIAPLCFSPARARSWGTPTRAGGSMRGSARWPSTRTPWSCAPAWRQDTCDSASLRRPWRSWTACGRRIPHTSCRASCMWRRSTALGDLPKPGTHSRF